MKTVSLLTYMAIFSLLLSGCVVGQAGQPATQATPKELQKIRLPMGYLPSVQYAPFYVAVEKGYFREAGLEMDFDYSFETDGVTLVGVDELPFSVASGEQVLLARDKGLPIVYVLAWWQDYPVAVSALSSQNLESPADLRGKKIGLPGPFGASYIGLRALLNAGGLKEEDVTLDSIGFNQVEALIAGQEEAIVVYANNEPIQLAALGYDVSTLPVSDYAQLASNGLITNEKTIAENPELVQRMVRAIMRGIQATIEDPEEAYNISLKYVEGLEQLNKDVQMEILDTSIQYWKANQPGFSQAEAWDNMDSLLRQMGMLTQPMDVSQAYTNQFVEAK